MRNTKPVLLLLCLFVQSTAGARPGPSGAQSEPLTLSAGAAIERELRPQETHVFRVSLRAGDFLEAEVIEKGINVVLRFYDPGGGRIAEESTVEGNFDTSEFEAIAPASGEFRLELAGTSKDPGQYQLRVTALRPGTERDRTDVKAHDAEQEARRLQQDNTPESRRKAIEKYMEVLVYRQATGDRKQEARTRADIGRLYFYLDDRSKALEYLGQALTLFREVNDRPSEAFVLNNLGAVHQDMGQPLKALDYFLQSLPGIQGLGDKYKEAVAVHNLGWCYHLLGDFKKASEFYRQALPLWRVGGNAFGEAQTLNNLGYAYDQLGDLRRSLEYSEMALQLRRTLKDGRGEAQTLGNLAYVHADLDAPDKAKALFNESLTVARQAQDKVSQVRALSGLALLAPGVVTIEQAFEYVNEAMSISDSLEDRGLEASTRFILGKLYHWRQETDLSVEKYKEALTLQMASGARRMEAATLLGLANVIADTGDLDEARIWNEKGLDVIESLRGRLAEPELRRSFLASMQVFYDQYIDLLMRLHEREPAGNYAALALQTSERARAQGLLDALADQPAQIRRGIDPALLERERQVQTALNAKEQQWRYLLSIPQMQSRANDAKRELDRLLDEFSQLQGEIQSHSPRYASLTQPKPVELKDLQLELDDNTLLLEYWLGKDHSFLWAVTANSFSSYTLPPAETIEESARQFFAALTSRTAPQPQQGAANQRLTAEADIPRLAAALSETLLGPVADRMENKNLVVVSHGALQYLPFAALPSPESSTKRAAGTSSQTLATLLDQHEIVSLPSASVIAALRTESGRRGNPEKLVAILADPVFSLEDPRFAVRPTSALPVSTRSNPNLRSAEESGVNELRRLRFSRVEADAIASLVRKDNRFEAVDFQASRNTALSAEIGQYRILHFATHGILNSVHPELSGLVFSTVDKNGQAQDGMLRLHEIFNMSLNAELVVLSACETALGKDIKGEGLVGLTRGFMYAGAPRVVASLWNVEDRATAELMKRFYDGMLKRQLRPAAALREAQLALQRDKRWSSPYYWAGFVLQGEWR